MLIGRKPALELVLSLNIIQTCKFFVLLVCCGIVRVKVIKMMKLNVDRIKSLADKREVFTD